MTAQAPEIRSEIRKKAERDRRRAIIDAARPVFLAEGYAATSMSTIVARVGGSKATLYSYFPSKEALFVAVIEETCEEVMSAVYDDVLEGADLRSTLTRIGRRFLSLILLDESIAMYRQVIAESPRIPEIGRTLHEKGLNRGVHRLAHYLETRMTLGQLRKSDAAEASEQFFDLCTGGILHRRLWNVAPMPTETEIAAQVDRATDTFLHGMLAGKGSGAPTGARNQ